MSRFTVFTSWFLGLALAAMALLVVLSHRAVRWVEDTHFERLASGGADRLSADLHRADRLFEVGHERDIGPLLNGQVLWDADVDGVGERAWWADGAAFDAFLPYRAEGAWMDGPGIVEDYDLSFLDEWRAYDHWDWWHNGPIPAHVQAHPEQPPFVSPIPNVVTFQHIARIRLAQGLRSGDLATALDEVHRVAGLLWSTETLVGGLVALAIVRFELRAVERGVERGLIPASAGPPVVEADIYALRDALFAQAHLYTAGTDLDAIARLLAEPALPGRCAALDEAASMLAMLHDVLDEPLPGEPDRTAHLDLLAGAMQTGTCRLDRARVFWSHPERAAAWRNDTTLDEPRVVRILLAVHWARQATARWWLSTAQPFTLGPYAEAARPAEPVR